MVRPQEDSGLHTGTAPGTRPLTGGEYIESLRDGREIYLYGDRVKDVTAHPAFRNAVRMTARMYDALHDPAKRDVLTGPTDTGSGGYTPTGSSPRPTVSTTWSPTSGPSPNGRG